MTDLVKEKMSGEFASGELYSYSQPIMATAVPVEPPAFDSDSNVYDSGSGPWVADDAIEKSSNIFNQV